MKLSAYKYPCEFLNHTVMRTMNRDYSLNIITEGGTTKELHQEYSHHNDNSTKTF